MAILVQDPPGQYCQGFRFRLSLQELGLGFRVYGFGSR